MFFNQFTHVMKYDASIVLEEPVDYASGIQSAMRIEGIDYAEGVLDIPVLLKNGYKQTGTKLIGIREGNYLYKAYDDFREINVPITRDGIIIGSILASSLDVEAGDTIYLSGPAFSEDIKIPILDIVNQNIGIDNKKFLHLHPLDIAIDTILFKYCKNLGSNVLDIIC